MRNDVSKAEKKKRIYSYIKLTILIIILILLPVYLLVFKADFITSIKTVSDVEEYLVSTPFNGLVVYAIVSILQVVISIIPAQAVQFAAGYVYGPFIGSIVAVLGIALGETVTFYLAKLLGKDALELIFKDKFNKFKDKVQSKKGVVFVSVIYLLPAMPKDLLCYVCGVSGYRYVSFILLSMTMRTPAIIGSVLIGVLTLNKSYYIAVIVLVSAAILTVVGYMYKDRIVNAAENMYIKYFKAS